MLVRSCHGRSEKNNKKIERKKKGATVLKKNCQKNRAVMKMRASFIQSDKE